LSMGNQCAGCSGAPEEGEILMKGKKAKSQTAFDPSESSYNKEQEQ